MARSPRTPSTPTIRRISSRKGFWTGCLTGLILHWAYYSHILTINQMRSKGKIIKWIEEKGFGFIAPSDRGNDIFFHKNAFLRQSRKPVIGDIVTFEAVSTLAGKTWAERILFQGQSDPRKIAIFVDLLLISFALSFLLILLFLYLQKVAPIYILANYYFFSFFTFFIYKSDKYAAQYGEWRSRESLLHFLSFVGGWPGALISQRILHHKSRKKSFQSVYWTVVLFNLILLGYFFVSSTQAYDYLLKIILQVRKY